MSNRKFGKAESGKIVRPDVDEIVSCRFRGRWIECTRAECRRNACDNCGWNPMVETKRIAKMTGATA